MKKAFIFFVLILSVIELKSQVLDVKEITQRKNQWCWAGVSACVLDYYCATTSQCEIAEYTRNVATWHDFGDVDCCTDPTQGCNYWNYNWGEPGSVKDILEHFGGIYNYGIINSLTKPQIIFDIQNNRLFIIRWEWNSGNGHVIVGHGIVDDNIYYMDPWYGEGLKIADYGWVCSSSDHKWTHTNRLTITPQLKLPDAETIAGPTTVCQGETSVTYEVPVIANATSYNWTLPDGASGTSTTNSINIDYSTSAISGDITVKGVNKCGEGAASTLPITVNVLPGLAGTLTGPTTVCQGETSMTYTVPAIANATSYDWTLPNGASGASTTNSINVDYSISAISGDITVKGVNSCGEGAVSTLPVTVNTKPTTPTITLNDSILESDSPNGNQWYDQHGEISGEKDQNLTVEKEGAYYVLVTLSGCTSNASNVIDVEITGIDVPHENRNIKIYPNPVSNELTLEIEGNNKKLHYVILNFSGQIIQKGFLMEKTIIQTSHFTSGVYFIRLENGKTFEFHKIIKEE